MKALEQHVPWHQIAKDLHVSPKTIGKVRDGTTGKKEREEGDDVAARAFALFKKGMAPEDVVVEMKTVSPGMVKELWTQFADFHGHTNDVCRSCHDEGYQEGYGDTATKMQHDTRRASS